MQQRLIPLTEEECLKIHRASVKILEKAGIGFPGGQALKIFQDHGFRTEGETVFITEEQLMANVAKAPATVPLVARNPTKNHLLGGEQPFLLGTGGAASVMEADGRMRLGLLNDHEKVQKLVQTSPVPQGAANKAVFPSDVPAQTAHLDMFFQILTLTDNFTCIDTQDSVVVRDALEMLAMVFDGRYFLKKNTVGRATISVLSPLKYAPEQVTALVMAAEHNQLSVIANMAMLGSTAP